jgi:hypothetical protein
MTSPLSEFCALVTEAGFTKSIALTSLFERLLAHDGVAIDRESHEAVFLTFAFMNWQFANGVWSNLENVRLRRDLMSESKNAMVLKAASNLCSGRDAGDIAALAVRVDFDEFQPFVRTLMDSLGKLDDSGITPDANAVLFFGLEWIQAKLGIPDPIMDRIVPSFLDEVGDFAEVETIAAHANRAAGARGWVATPLDWK